MNPIQNSTIQACSALVTQANLHCDLTGLNDVAAVHGTGTPLGDPIEIGAAAASLMGSPDRRQPLFLSAAKSIIGHAEPAAGAVGLLSLISTLASHQRQPILHLRTLNPLVASAMGAVSGASRFGVAIARGISAVPTSSAVTLGTCHIAVVLPTRASTVSRRSVVSSNRVLRHSIGRIHLILYSQNS